MPLQVPCSVLMDDLDLALCTDEPGAARAHGGFLRAYLSVREAVHRLLKELGGTTLLVTGHSLGVEFCGGSISESDRRAVLLKKLLPGVYSSLVSN